MSPQALHLMLNHVPVIGSLLATAVLAFGLLRRQEDIIRLSLYLFIFAAVMALPVYFSGEGAEEAVEHLPGVAEALIEDHEHLAEVAIWLIQGLGLAAIGGLVLSFRQTRLPLWFAAVFGLLALGNGGVLAQTAHLGGQIRHSEIRQGAQPNKAEKNPEGPDNSQPGDDDDRAVKDSDSDSKQPPLADVPQTQQGLLSLESLLQKVFGSSKIQLLQAEFEEEHGQSVYELKWLQQGQIQKARFDARSGQRLAN